MRRYWATGYARLEFPACRSTTAFFFAQVPAFGWFRYGASMAHADGPRQLAPLVPHSAGFCSAEQVHARRPAPAV